MAAAAIQTICAIGTGSMGAGTALCFAKAGYTVRLYGRSETSLESAMQNIQSALATFHNKGLIEQSDIPAILARIQTTTSLEKAAADADLVIESVAEDLSIKQTIFAELDRICPERTIFATNTSSLSPTEIAAATKRQDKFVVTHFFNPPQLMPLVEVVPGQQTSIETLNTACALMEVIGKNPILLQREAPGFVVNMVQVHILQAACHLVQANNINIEAVDSAVRQGLNLREMDIAGEINRNRGQIILPPTAAVGTVDYIVGTIRTAMLETSCRLVEQGIASPEVIESAIKTSLALRLPETGPLESADMGGLDIFAAIFKSVGLPVPKLIEDAQSAGHLGTKTGRGIYVWSEEKLADARTRRENALFAYLAEIGPIPAQRSNTSLLEKKVKPPDDPK